MAYYSSGILTIRNNPYLFFRCANFKIKKLANSLFFHIRSKEVILYIKELRD